MEYSIVSRNVFSSQFTYILPIPGNHWHFSILKVLISLNISIWSFGSDFCHLAKFIWDPSVLFMYHWIICFYFWVISHCMDVYVCLGCKSCLTLCESMDCSLPGSSVRGIFQARILEWVAISFSRKSSQSRNWTHIFCISCIGRWILYHWTTWEAQLYGYTIVYSLVGHLYCFQFLVIMN